MISVSEDDDKNPFTSATIDSLKDNDIDGICEFDLSVQDINMNDEEEHFDVHALKQEALDMAKRELSKKITSRYLNN
jgi:hypothetical protein